MNPYKVIYNYHYSSLSQKLVTYINPYLTKDDNVLDIGSGNGYVARQISSQIKCKITCLDVLDLNKVGPKPIIYDGLKFPFRDKTFTSSLVLFCLHHTDKKKELLQEAIRTTKSRIIIMEDYSENIYDYSLNFYHKLNSLIKFHSGYIKYLNDKELRKMFAKLGLKVEKVVKIPVITNPLHPTRKIIYVLKVNK